MSTIEVETIPRVRGYNIYVQKNLCRPPEGKCHVLCRCHRTLWCTSQFTTDPSSKCSIWVKDLAMHWRKREIKREKNAIASAKE